MVAVEQAAEHGSSDTKHNEDGFASISVSGGLTEPYLRGLLTKWGIAPHAQLLTFRYFKPYHKMQAHQLALDLLNSPCGQDAFQVACTGGAWLPVRGRITSVELQPVPADETRLDMFDRLSSAQPPIVYGNGRLVQRMEDFVDDVQVCDMLREMLVCEDSENAELYSEEERSQLLFRLLRFLVLGGSCCQFESELEPYLEATKRLYKQLLSVQKNAVSGALEVASQAYSIVGITASSGIPLFPTTAPNNVCFMTVEPLRRTVKILYHAHLPFW